jgi:hypothetical protein
VPCRRSTALSHPALCTPSTDHHPLLQRGTESGWACLPDELLAPALEAAGWLVRGLGFSDTSATARLVCAAWKAVHDALVKWLVLRHTTTDKATATLVQSFPSVVSLEVNVSYGEWAELKDETLRAVIK